ncbi:MAG: hypothetical protein FJY65_11875 [Calditrichaeota bacterium]|nr:hypothetical protein [Calditrichota bacterium]
MITKIKFGAFKSHINSELPLEPLTIIVGANASGKTNALEGLRLLSTIATGAELGHALEESEGHIRGGSNQCAPFGKEVFSLGCEFQLPHNDDVERFIYEVSLSNGNPPLIENESIRFALEPQRIPLFAVDGSDKSIMTVRVKVDNFQKGANKPYVTLMARIPVLFQIVPAIRLHRRTRENKNLINRHKMIVEQITTSLSSIFVFNPVPDIIRDAGYISIEKNEMDPTGKNLSGVLYNIFSKDKGKKDEIINLLKALPEHEILDIKFVETKKQDVQLFVQERFHGNLLEVPLSLLSDGTIRLLAILATAFSSRQGSLIVIEEVDTSLHPSTVGRLLDSLANVAQKNDARLLVTTHNSALLDAVKPENYRSVVLCFRQIQDGYSNFIRLIDVPDIETFILREKLGQIIVNTRYYKLLRKSEEERKAEREQILFNWKAMGGA